MVINNKSRAFNAFYLFSKALLFFEHIKFFTHLFVIVCNQNEVEVMFGNKFLVRGEAVWTYANYLNTSFGKRLHLITKATSLQSTSWSVIFGIKIKYCYFA